MDETLTWADTLIIPIFGSVALLGMWLIIKYAGKKWINIVLGVYCKLHLMYNAGSG
jgi:minor histocompatibility antigen H13